MAWKFGDEEGTGKEGVLQAGAHETRRALLPAGGCPPGDPGLASGPGGRSALTSGLKLLWAELSGASAAASASRGSSGLRAGRAAGDMVRGRPGRPACGSAAGPSLGVAPPLPRTPLSPEAPSWLLESGPPGEEALVPSAPSARRLPSVLCSFFCLVGELDGEPSLALSSGPSLYPAASPPAHAPMPSFPGADVVVSA